MRSRTKRGGETERLEILSQAGDLERAAQELVEAVLTQDRLATPAPSSAVGRARSLNDAINGAAVAISLGHHVGLPDRLLRDLARGMLLRDIEQASIEGLARPLNERGHELVQQRAERGHERRHQLQWGTAAARFVVLQHHERRDGTRYPGRLLGRHSARRHLGEHFNRDLMHPLAKIAGGADTLTALNADRAHRPALNADEIGQELLKMAQQTLSPGVVWRLLADREAPLDGEAQDHNVA